jgi:hypothetical protein
MLNFKNYLIEVKEPTGSLKDACWKGYTAVGMKMKNGKKVPNCVPVKEEDLKESGGEVVYRKDGDHVEKYTDHSFAVYRDGKKQTFYKTLAAAKAALGTVDEQFDIIEDKIKVGDLIVYNKNKTAETYGKVHKIETDHYIAHHTRTNTYHKLPKKGSELVKNEEVEAQFDLIEEMVNDIAEQHNLDPEMVWEKFEDVSDDELFEAAVDAKGYKSSTGGLTQKGRDHYNNTEGGNLKAPVTTPPSKLKAGSKAANRRKSFCARMGGMKKRLTSAKTAKDPDSRINKALRKWNC